MIVDDFKKLIENNKGAFTDDEIGLFNDSVRCFHAGIYRPAYILAYQGMMIYFRRMIQDAKMPTGYDVGKWKGIQTRLAKDKEWEDEVNNAIRTQPDLKKKPPVIAILCMTDSMRKDFDYWRNRRNDCAHDKEYNINDSHVLSFYSFLTQYLLKISVEGGMMTLLNEFKDACDTSKTSPSVSLQPLVYKILTMVNPDEMNTFFDYLEGVMGYGFDGRYEQTLAGIIKGGNEDLKNYLIKYVRANNSVKLNLINKCPDLVGHLVEKSEVREYWMKNLKDSRNRVAVLAHMLMIGMIAPDEKDEAIRKVLYYCYDNNDGMGEVSDEELLALKGNGFYDILKEEYFNSNYTCSHAKDCGKYRYNFFLGYVYHLPVDKEWVSTIVDIFSEADYPTVWLSIFKERFLENNEYKVKFEKIVSDNSIKLPDCLK